MRNCKRRPQIPGNFTQINMQDGGFLTGIVQHPSGRLIARTDGGGIYSSDNQANLWTFLCSNMVTSAALVPQGVAVPQTAGSSSNLILMACGYGTQPASDQGRGVWKSTDGGATWTQTLTNVWLSGGDNERVGGECIIFHPTNDSEAFVGTRAYGFWRSSDAGSTWTLNTALPTNIIFSSIYIHPSFPDQIFAGGDNGLWVSVNHGTSWTQLNTYSLVYRVTRGTDGTVYYSGINGSKKLIQKITATSWNNTATYTYTDLYSSYTNGIGDNGLVLNTASVLQDGRLLVGDEYGNTRISANEGVTFSTMPFIYAPGLPIPQWASTTTFEWRPTSLIQDVNNTNFWYGGGGYGPIATTNSGTNWQYIVNGIGEVVTWKVCFHPTDSNRLYIPCMDLGGAIVTDGGFSGNTVSMAHEFFQSDVTQYAHRALSCYTNGYNRVIFAGGSELTSQGRLYATTNDGASWYLPASVGLPTSTSGAVIEDAMDSLDNPDDFLVLIGGNTGVNAGGVYRTTDAGASFTQCSWYPSSRTFLGAFQYTFVYLDRDATNADVRYLFSRAAFPSAPPATNSGGGFFISTNRGVTWTQTTGATGAIVPGDYSDWQGVMMVSDHGLSGNIWIAVEGGSQGLAHSVNSGSNWTWVPGFTNVMAVDAFNGDVVVLGQTMNDAWNKIYYSANNGATWNEVTGPNYRFGNAYQVALDPYRRGRIFISTGERSVGIFYPSNLPPAAPAITRQPVSQAVYLGSQATLSVATAGVGPLFYHWQFNSSNLNVSAQGPILTLPAFAATNAGNYDVVISNAGGSVTSSVAVLSVGTLPGASIPAGSLTAVVGSDVTLNATTSGTSPYLYLWELNGAALPDIITTVAGDGGNGESGDGGMATNATLYAGPVTVDGAGGFYIADSANGRVRHVNASGIISTVAGNGTLGFSGDGGPATNAQFQNPAAVAVDAWGNLYIADEDNNRVRRMDTHGVITTVAGNGFPSYWGDGAAATNANISSPVGVAVDASGNLYIADQGNNAIRQVATNGIISTVAGNGANVFFGDGGQATNASLSSPADVVVDAVGNLFIADSGNKRIRKVAVSGVISTVAGSGNAGYYGDGGAATGAFMESPASVAVDALGNLYIADGTEHVRKVNVKGIISTVAGNAGLGYSGDGGPATNSKLSEVYGVATDLSGNVYLADTGDNCIRKISAFGAELPLDNFSAGQSGTYQLILSNAFGSSTSAVIVVTAVLPPVTLSLGGGEAVQLQYTGMPGSNYVLQATTNLASPANWRPLATNTAAVNGMGTFIDTNTPSGQAKFYRLGLP